MRRLIARLRGLIQTLDGDCVFPDNGVVFLRRQGGVLIGIDLLLRVRGFGWREFDTDYHLRRVIARPQHWARLTFNTVLGLGQPTRWEFARGTHADPRTARPIPHSAQLFREAHKAGYFSGMPAQPFDPAAGDTAVIHLINDETPHE